jgi:glutathione S-transferase
MLSKHIKIDLNPILVNLLEGDHLKPEFLALNPTHTVPTIVDHGNNDLVLWESRAIMIYLVEKYAPGNDIYPTDPTKRAQVNKWLFYDASVLIPTGRPYYRPTIYCGAPLKPELEAPLREKLAEFETTFKRQNTKYIAGNTLTLADLAIVATISHISAVTQMDLSMYPTVLQWWDMLQKELPYYDEVNGQVLKDFRNLIEAKMAAYKP